MQPDEIRRCNHLLGSEFFPFVNERRKGFSMAAVNFPEPIFIWNDPEVPEKGTKQLSSVEDSIAALFRADINEYSTDDRGNERAIWKDAVRHLCRAKLARSPESAVLAHHSMRRLAHAVGILAPRYGLRCAA